VTACIIVILREDAP